MHRPRILVLFGFAVVGGVLAASGPGSPARAQAPPDLNAQLDLPARLEPQGQTDNPVPPQARIDSARRDVSQLYARELADRSPEARAALVRRMIAQAPTSDALDVEYAVYLEAIDAAWSVGDVEGALAAVDAIDRRFAVPPLEMHALRGDVINRLGGRAAGADAVKKLMDAGKHQVEALLADNLYHEAFELAGALRHLNRKLRNTLYEYHFEADLTRWQQLQTARRRARPALLRLKENPDDPIANDIAGRFYCFELGAWDVGLPLLAKSHDPALKNLAAADLANPEDVHDRLAVADGWYELTFAPRQGVNQFLRKRARHWYTLAEPDVSGVQKLDVANKLRRLARYRSTDEVLARLNPAQAQRIVRFRDKLLLARQLPATFADAQAWCRSTDGDLACIRDREENRLIALLVADYLQPQDDYKFWVGGTRADSPAWTWVDGSAFNYQNWRRDQPNNAGGNQFFIALKADGSWGDEPGDAEYPFVAQWQVAD